MSSTQWAGQTLNQAERVYKWKKWNLSQYLHSHRRCESLSLERRKERFIHFCLFFIHTLPFCCCKNCEAAALLWLMELADIMLHNNNYLWINGQKVNYLQSKSTQTRPLFRDAGRAVWNLPQNAIICKCFSVNILNVFCALLWIKYGLMRFANH